MDFEDLFGNPEGAAGFNDIHFTFTNVKSSTSVPDASNTLALLGTPLVGLFGFSRRLKKS